jgi:ketosteroid isomerase-like protein
MRSMAISGLLVIAFSTTAFAQDPASEAKKTCETLYTIAATGDAAKMAKYYTENAVYVGPAPVAGIIVGRAAIEKSYAGAFERIVMSGTCDNAAALNHTTAVVSGHWTGTPKDPARPTVKGTYGLTLVADGAQWLVAFDVWNIDLPSPPVKSQ